MKDSKITNPGWKWDPSYLQLPELFYSRVRPVPSRRPHLVALNHRLGQTLGLDPDKLVACAAIFGGNEIPEATTPIAQAYAGHQFGHFTSLGDGRAMLLGEHITPGGERFDIQLKGSGRNLYSRGGDGRAALGPMLREYIISEAMHALGIPTTRSLAVVSTGEEVIRQDLLPGAVLTRVAASHIRVGTFQHAAAHDDISALRALAEYTRARHFPELKNSETPHFDFFQAVIERQAALIAKWLHVGFIHGVMNTDNMAISGETIDYGPCAFMNEYDPDTVFSSIDRQGRYAYGSQPQIARWNLARLAETLLPLFHEDQKIAVDLANQALGKFEGRFQFYWLQGMRAKIGLLTSESEDAALVQELLDWMHDGNLDFTHTFRTLSSTAAMAEPTFIDAKFFTWHQQWAARLARQPHTPSEAAELMARHNPAVIPRNHMVEEALSAAGKGDLSVMHRLLEVLAEPYSATAPEEFTMPPPLGGPVYQTFCGT